MYGWKPIPELVWLDWYSVVIFYHMIWYDFTRTSVNSKSRSATFKREYLPSSSEPQPLRCSSNGKTSCTQPKGYFFDILYPFFKLLFRVCDRISVASRLLAQLVIIRTNRFRNYSYKRHNEAFIPNLLLQLLPSCLGIVLQRTSQCLVGYEQAHPMKSIHHTFGGISCISKATCGHL